MISSYTPPEKSTHCTKSMEEDFDTLVGHVSLCFQWFNFDLIRYKVHKPTQTPSLEALIKPYSGIVVNKLAWALVCRQQKHEWTLVNASLCDSIFITTSGMSTSELNRWTNWKIHMLGTHLFELLGTQLSLTCTGWNVTVYVGIL